MPPFASPPKTILGLVKMERITFKLKTITPLFLSGAYQQFNLNDGLRPPSLRGLMRWWFRAIAGAKIGNNIKMLKHAESSIFGSTSARSSITIRTSSNRILQRRIKILQNEDLFRKRSEDLYPRIKYFFYSARQYPYLEPDNHHSSFDFTLSIHGDEDKVKVASALVWAMFHLGGIGLRSRRGAGCMNIVGYEGSNSAQLEYTPVSADNLSSFIKDNLAKVRKTVFDYLDQIEGKKPNATPISNNWGFVSQYAVLSPNQSVIFICDHKHTTETINDWKKALEKIGQWYLGATSKKGNQIRFKNGFRMRMIDLKLSNQIKKDNLPPTYSHSCERRIFLGLPLIYASEKQNAEVTIVADS